MPDNNTKVTVGGGKQGSSVPQPMREWDPFTNLQREMDQLFNSVRGGFWRSPLGHTVSDLEPYWRRGAGQALAPAVDIAETDKQYELTAELPGLQPEHVEVKLANGVLTIKGEKKEEKEEKKEGYYLSERRYGSFQRAFAVPDGVDAEKVSADFKNGVLTVVMPKSPEVQEKERKIAIQSR
ncbi:MAG: Hsp20/alpha crystallin family protein [Rhodomicrobium sp.]|nr:Hsp20/alpha crystallin family protein [Rhodomicrobium sp.]